MAMRKVSIVRCVLVTALFLVCMGCKKQQTTLEEPKPEPTPPPPVVIAEPDTSDNVSFNEADLDAEFRRKVEENMQTIYFDYNSYSLKPVEIEKLGTAGAFLMEYPTSRILVEGHCDERGSSEYNMGLGENRARVVKEYLVNYGIPANRLEITSWGKERPVTPGCVDESCHSRNRRAEYKVLSR